MSGFNRGGFSLRQKPHSTGESWWSDAPRLGFTANAASRFSGCLFPSHKTRVHPVYPDTMDTFASKRVPRRSAYLNPEDLPDLESVGIANPSTGSVESADESEDES